MGFEFAKQAFYHLFHSSSSRLVIYDRQKPSPILRLAGIPSPMGQVVEPMCLSAVHPRLSCRARQLTNFPMTYLLGSLK
jgi:hypothetical protein